MRYVQEGGYEGLYIVYLCTDSASDPTNYAQLGLAITKVTTLTATAHFVKRRRKDLGHPINYDGVLRSSIEARRKTRGSPEFAATAYFQKDAETGPTYIAICSSYAELRPVGHDY